MANAEIIDLIRRLYTKCREQERTIASTPFDGNPREYVNQLSPPPGVMHCDRKTVTVFEDESFVSQLWLPLQTLTWKVDVYTYVTGALPDDPDFEGNGGSVMIVMVHSGLTSFTTAPGGGSLHRINAPTSVEPQVQLPPSGSGIQNGEYWNYTIAYQELMHLFNNGGNNTIEFNALYKEDFSRLHHKQSGIVTSNGVEFGSSFTEPSSIPRYNLSGVSVFRSTDPSAFPLTFSFDAYAFLDLLGLRLECLKTKQITVDLDI